MIKVKRARYVTILPSDSGDIYCRNIVTGVYCSVNKEEMKLINFLSHEYKTYDQVQQKFGKIFNKTLLETTLNKLIEKNILVTESNDYANNFKEDILIVGCGFDPIFDSISLEAYTIVKNCNKVYCVYDEDFCNEIRKINNNVVSLGNYLSEYGPIETAKKFIEIASKEDNVIFLTRGNPFVGEWIPHLIVTFAEKRKMTSKIIPSQSSLDKMFIDIKLDPFEGLTITRSDSLEKTLESDKPTLITLVGYKYGSMAHSCPNFNSMLEEELRDIKKILLQKFPENHTVYLLNPRGTFTLSLKEIENFSKFWEKRKSTLYIPTLTMMSIEDLTRQKRKMKNLNKLKHNR